jgi:hypothetical protein
MIFGRIKMQHSTLRVCVCVYQHLANVKKCYNMVKNSVGKLRNLNKESWAELIKATTFLLHRLLDVPFFCC